MKFLFDLFPVILFFLVFKWGEGHAATAQSVVQQYLSGLVSGNGVVESHQAPILLATAVAIVATLAQIGYLLARRRKVDGMLWMSLVIIGVFGSATIYFHNENFIKWKPTVLYWCFSLALLVSQLFFNKNLIRTMLEKQLALPEPVWTRLNFAWAAFFAFMGGLNLLVAFGLNLSTATWVNFKLFGATGLMFVFVIGQTIYLSKYMKDAP
ncbi:MAG: septation protein A [Herminiimonas sp.]|nr:septation protein A [Herminiimonas sp.]